MANTQYVELQVTTNFSFLRGASHPEEYFEEAQNLGYQALAVTDQNSLAGIVRAHQAAKKHDVSLIVGTQVTLYDTLPEHEKEEGENLLPFSLLLYPSDKKAYGNLSKLLTRGKRRAPKGKCFLKLADLNEYSRGILGIITLQDWQSEKIEPSLPTLKDIFSDDRLSLAITHNYNPQNQACLRYCKELAHKKNIPLVVTNNVYYHHPDRRILQDTLSCIRLRTTIAQAGFHLFQNAERFLKSPKEMERLFAKFPEAILRSREIADRLSRFSLDQLRYEYPKEVCPEGKAPIQYLTELSWKAAREKYPSGVPAHIAKLLLHELQLIEELDYPKYFLTVYDIVTFARSKDILCQGRGAAANSVVCYVLGITAVDPNYIPLLVERFISKERNEPPDIDIDFEHERREEVIQYIYKKYGRERTALVAEVITYRTRSAVRDVGKVFSLSEENIEGIVKLLTRSSHREFSSEDLEERGLSTLDPNIVHTIRLSQELAGFPRHLSQHVGGFVISEAPLCEIVPIENARMIDRTVIEWDKDDVDAVGMLKIDVLGLGMLTCIRKAFSLINDLHPEHRRLPKNLLKLHRIPPEDPNVYEMISRAETLGVFQIESRAQMNMLPRLRPQCFYDLVIEVAIVRPGPIQGDMVHPYLRRRNGLEQITYPNEKMKHILHRTLGVPIFQEQVMEIAVAAGFSAGEADELRRAMASWKRHKNAIERFKKRLFNGMKENGYSEDFTKRIFEQIKGFGEYGFPQSHAASFALLVYVSAWLKKYYPAAFGAALINSQPMGFYRPAQIIQDAKDNDVVVQEIDVNFSKWDCTLETEKTLRLGMRLVKSLREEEALRIASAVEIFGRFQSILELWRKSGVFVDSLKSLAKADAFRSLGLDRQAALWEIKKLRDDPLPLFKDSEQLDPKERLPYISRELHVLRDYQTTGLSLKAHPVSFLREKLDTHKIQSALEMKDPHSFPNGAKILVSGIVLVRQKPMTASGVVFMTIEDETGSINLIIRPQVFERHQDEVFDSRLVIAAGKIQREREIINVIVDEILDGTSLLGQLETKSRNFH